MEAAGLSKITIAVKVLEEALPLLGSASEAGREVLSVLNKLSKLAPSGSVPTGVVNSSMQNIQQRQAQMQPLIAAMRAQGAGGGAPGGAAPPPAAQAA